MEAVIESGRAEQWESDVVLADGGVVHLRPVRSDDRGRLAGLLTGPESGAAGPGGSPEAAGHPYRLLLPSPAPKLSARDVERFTRPDPDTRMALVAVLGEDLIALARYDRLPGTDEAEVAFLVQPAHQGRGIGTLLLEHLAAVGREHGVRRFVADTTPDNQRMLEVFRNAGYRLHSARAGDLVHVEFPIEPTESARAAMEERERHAEARSMARLLAPRSVAVIGASTQRGTIGHEVFRNLLAGDFNGPIYPVHPTAGHVAGVRAYERVLDVPDDVDLAVVTVPAAAVLDVVQQCADKRVRGLVVISAGFAEIGPEGAKAERALTELARGHGMRMVGPNCMGVMNTAPDVRLNATFSAVPPMPGRVGFMSQSGGLGVAVLELAQQLGLGLSTFVSLGNKADVSGNDVLMYWEEDPRTDVVLLYLESFGNPRTFSRVARRLSRRKPVVAVKSGRSAAGARGAQSHTAAMASPEVVVQALFHQTGVIRVDTLEQLFDVARVLVDQPLPGGRGVAIVGNTGGPGILAADACEGAGLVVPELSPATQQRLRSVLSAAAAVRNPVDLVASAGAEEYEQALRIVMTDPQVDSVIAIFVPPLVTRPEDVARGILAAASDAGAKPVLANFVAMEDVPQVLRTPPLEADGRARRIPTFAFPEDAAQALARVAAYAEWQAAPEGSVPRLSGVDAASARARVDGALAERPEGVWLDPAAALELCALYGIPVAPTRHVGSAEEAARVAGSLGYPVALKAGSPDIVHKTDVGAVRLGLASADQVAEAYSAMAAALGPKMGGGVVQRMVPAGVETIVGVVHDPSFGPLVMFGMGGVATELFQDRAFHIVPLTDVDAHQVVSSVKGAPLLTGYRGAPPTDVAALEELLLRVSRLVDDLPEVAEMDINPVIVSPEGAVAVDAKVRLAPSPARAPESLRRLP